MQPIGLDNMLGGLLAGIPVALVWLAGLVMAVVTWRRHPRVSLLAVVGLLVLGLAGLVGIFAGSSLPLFLHTRTGQNFDQIGRVVFGVNLALALVRAVGWGMVIAAVFVGRRND